MKKKCNVDTFPGTEAIMVHGWQKTDESAITWRSEAILTNEPGGSSRHGCKINFSSIGNNINDSLCLHSKSSFTDQKPYHDWPYCIYPAHDAIRTGLRADKLTLVVADESFAF